MARWEAWTDGWTGGLTDGPTDERRQGVSPGQLSLEGTLDINVCPSDGPLGHGPTFHPLSPRLLHQTSTTGSPQNPSWGDKSPSARGVIQTTAPGHPLN